MSYKDHGAYTPPSEQPLHFDARQPMRGSSPMPTTLIASVVLLTIVAGGGVLLWRHGVSAPASVQAANGPPTVGAEVGPTRTAAPASAQPQDPTQGLQIYRTEAPQPATPVMAPPPETPTPRAATAGPPQIAVARAPVETVTLAAPPAPPPAIAAPTPATTRATRAPAAPAPSLDSLVEAARHGAVQPRPALHTAPVATGSSGLRSSVAAPLINPPAPLIQAPLAAGPTARPAAAGGGTTVQIGAFSSSALADRGLSDAARVAPGAAAGRGRRIEPVSVGGHTLYRTSMTGFASHADAVAFCDQLRAGGKTCFVR